MTPSFVGLSRVAHDLRTIASLTTCGEDGRQVLAKAVEYIEALARQYGAETNRQIASKHAQRMRAYRAGTK